MMMLDSLMMDCDDHVGQMLDSFFGDCPGYTDIDRFGATSEPKIEPLLQSPGKGVFFETRP